MEWEQDQMKFYVDDNLFSTVTKADLGANNYPFNEQFYFIVNLAVGGNIHMAGHIPFPLGRSALISILPNLKDLLPLVMIREEV